MSGKWADQNMVEALRKSADRHTRRYARHPLAIAAGLRHGMFLDDLLEHVESHIEAVMLAALLRVIDERCTQITTDLPPGKWNPPSAGDCLVRLIAQAPIGSYRADFALDMNTLGASCRVVVECDGHDFHERTKEQAKRDRSRDRAMQAAGLIVLRYTGAEIFADAIACADQVVTVAGDRCYELSYAAWHAAHPESA